MLALGGLRELLRSVLQGDEHERGWEVFTSTPGTVVDRAWMFTRPFTRAGGSLFSPHDRVHGFARPFPRATGDALNSLPIASDYHLVFSEKRSSHGSTRGTFSTFHRWDKRCLLPLTFPSRMEQGRFSLACTVPTSFMRGEYDIDLMVQAQSDCQDMVKDREHISRNINGPYPTLKAETSTGGLGTGPRHWCSFPAYRSSGAPL
jgi:hypothetical protein